MYLAEHKLETLKYMNQNPPEKLSQSTNANWIPPEPVILPLYEFSLPIYTHWDKMGFPCPRHPDGWLAFNEQRKQEMQNRPPETPFNWGDDKDMVSLAEMQGKKNEKRRS